MQILDNDDLIDEAAGRAVESARRDALAAAAKELGVPELRADLREAKATIAELRTRLREVKAGKLQRDLDRLAAANAALVADNAALRSRCQELGAAMAKIHRALDLTAGLAGRVLGK